MTPIEIGGLMSGAGSLLSGLGIGSKASKGPSPAEQAAATLGYERDSFNQKMKLAEDHGIHKLSMLGVPMGSFTPAFHVGSDSGPDFAAIGHGANQIARSLVKPPESETDQAADRLLDANIRIAEANAKRAEWAALGEEWRVADMAAPALINGQPGNPPGARVSNDVVQMSALAGAQSGLDPAIFAGGSSPIKMEQSVLPPHPLKLGHGAATDQAHVTVMGADGKPASMLNQNVVNAEFEQGATMTVLTRMFGLERATEIMAVLEQKGLLGAAALGVGALGKFFYDRMGKQRTDAFKQRDSRAKQANDFRKKMKARGAVYAPGYGWYYPHKKGGDE